MSFNGLSAFQMQNQMEIARLKNKLIDRNLYKKHAAELTVQLNSVARQLNASDRNDTVTQSALIKQYKSIKAEKDATLAEFNKLDTDPELQKYIVRPPTKGGSKKKRRQKKQRRTRRRR
jgi:uncharacterized protein HemY